MNPTPREFVSLHNDIAAYNFNENGPTFYTGEHPLTRLEKRFHDISYPKIKTNYGEFSLRDFDNSLKWKQQNIVGKYNNNPDFENYVFDSDRSHNIMGGYRWDFKKLPDGNLHFQSNDTWDLHPWQRRGASSLAQQTDVYGAFEKLATMNERKGFQNVEALKLLGGKPFNIRNNFIVDPKTYEVIHSYKKGGVIKDNDGYWNPDNWGKVVEIDSPDITMRGVDQPLIGISDEGDVQYMEPGQDYKFKGKKVKEYPVTKSVSQKSTGGWLSQYK